MAKRFENAINALVKGFFENTLVKGSCTACAVGNIIHYNCNVKINYSEENPQETFSKLEYSDVWYNITENHRFVTNKEKGLELISKTGYSIKEITTIEKAFESNTKIFGSKYFCYSKSDIMEDQYKGLMAVVKVLCNIEGLESKEYKLLFEYEPILTN